MRKEPASHVAERRIARLAATQHGVVAVHQLSEAGLSAGAVHRRVQAGRLHRLHRGVYALGHRRLTAEGRWMAAVLACGQGAVLSHRSAAAHLGIRPSASARIEVTVPTYAGRERPGIAIHRSLTLDRAVTVHEDIPVTTPARTLVDIAGLVGPASLERSIERAESLGLFDLRALRALLVAHPRRPGSGALEAILGRHVVVTRSELEARFIELCATYRIPRPEVNVRIDGYEVDFLWRAERLVVETDGYRYHRSRAAFEREHVRDARLAVAGYRVLRFTWWQVTEGPAAVARSVLALLA